MGHIEIPSVGRVALKPIRRDMKLTRQSANQKIHMEVEGLSSRGRDMVIFGVISIIPGPNVGESIQAYIVRWICCAGGCVHREIRGTLSALLLLHS
jgi:hypothetical protein